MRKRAWLVAVLATVCILAACDRDDDDVVVVPQSDASSSVVASSVAVTTELDGTFVLKQVDETKTLTISQGTGTLETIETDGDTDRDQVQVDGSQKTILVGDDLYTYELQGSTLTLTDDDGEQDVYTKQ